MGLSILQGIWESRDKDNPTGVHKNNPPEKQLHFKEVVRRVMYRYFTYILLPAKAVARLPFTFADYTDVESNVCMLTPGIIKDYGPQHFSAYGWYLDCHNNKCPSCELELRNKIEPSLGNKNVVELEDEEETAPAPEKEKKSRLRKRKKGDDGDARKPSAPAKNDVADSTALAVVLDPIAIVAAAVLTPAADPTPATAVPTAADSRNPSRPTAQTATPLPQLESAAIEESPTQDVTQEQRRLRAYRGAEDDDDEDNGAPVEPAELARAFTPKSYRDKQKQKRPRRGPQDVLRTSGSLPRTEQLPSSMLGMMVDPVPTYSKSTAQCLVLKDSFLRWVELVGAKKPWPKEYHDMNNFLAKVHFNSMLLFDLDYQFKSLLLNCGLRFVACISGRPREKLFLKRELIPATPNPVTAVDLLIADYPDGKRVPGVSNPAHAVPNWNEQNPTFVKSFMMFSDKYLHDDGALLFFYPDSANIKREIMSYFKSYKLKIFDEWNVFQTLPLASHSNDTKTVSFRNQSKNYSNNSLVHFSF